MSFPLSPSDGDTFLTSLNVLYKYDASRLSWLIQSGAGGSVGPGTPHKVSVFNGTGTTIGDCDSLSDILLGSKDVLAISCYDTSSQIIIETYDEINALHEIVQTSNSSTGNIISSDSNILIQTTGTVNTSITFSPQDSDDTNHPVAITADSGNNVYIGTAASDKLWLQSNSSGDALTINNLGSLSSINLNGTTVTISGTALNFNSLPVVVEQNPLTDWPSSSALPQGITTSFFNATYKVIDKMCHMWFLISGTSTAATLTFTLPFIPAHSGTYAQVVEFCTTSILDNSLTTGTPGLAVIDTTGNATVALYKNTNSNSTWSGSGLKQAQGYVVYQIA